MMTIGGGAARDFARGTWCAGIGMSTTESSSMSRRFLALRSLSTSSWPALAATAAIHLYALIRLSQTEVGWFAQSLFLLVWICLNCFWLLMLRRPAISAALSLGMFELLIAISLFKFKITW